MDYTTRLHRLTLALLTLTATISISAQERIYLSGTGIDDTRTWDFKCDKGRNSGKWHKIQVPCNWELQGFGAYTYGRYYTKPGEKPSDEHERSSNTDFMNSRLTRLFSSSYSVTARNLRYPFSDCSEGLVNFTMSAK